MHMYNLSLLVYCQNTEISLGFDFEQTLIEPIYDYHHAAGSWGGGDTSCKENSPIFTCLQTVICPLPDYYIL